MAATNVIVIYYPETEEEVIEEATLDTPKDAAMWLASRLVNWCVDEDVRIIIDGQAIN